MKAITVDRVMAAGLAALFWYPAPSCPNWLNAWLLFLAIFLGLSSFKAEENE